MKGIIVAAGYGTRFLPVTKTVPKELLPLVNVPSIQFIVDEFTAAGITDILIISSRRKKVLEDYFDREVELEEVFGREGKKSSLDAVAPPCANIAFVRQKRMMGTGHALLQVKPWVGSDSCVVAYPDDLHFGQRPLAGQLIEVWKRRGCSVMAAVHEPGDVSRYGVLDMAADGVMVRGIVEKPPVGTEPSHEISIGRYLYTPEFFDLLEEGWRLHEQVATQEGRVPAEYYHVYALNRLMAEGKVAACRAEGQRLDTGDPAGYLQAFLTYADSRSDLRPVLDAWLATRGQFKPHKDNRG